MRVVCLVVALAMTSSVANAEDLLPVLRKGGCVVFFRHPTTNPDQADTDPLHLENVQAQRQLTDEGRKQATAIGTAWRTLKLPVEKVIASKFQRAQDAAKLLDLGNVQASLDVSEGGLVVSPNENKRRAEALKVLLSTPTAAGKNLIIVSHKPNLQDAAGKDFGDLGEAEAAVFQPLGEGKWKLLGRVKADQWGKWSP